MLADETKKMMAMLSEDTENQISEVQDFYKDFGHHISRREIIGGGVGIGNKRKHKVVVEEDGRRILDFEPSASD